MIADLRPWVSRPDEVKNLCPALRSCLSMVRVFVSGKGGVRDLFKSKRKIGANFHFSMFNGDLRTDEKLAGTVACACGSIEWSEEVKTTVKAALETQKQTSKDSRLKRYLMMGEVEVPGSDTEKGTGFYFYDSHNLMRERDRESVPVDDRRDICIGWVQPTDLSEHRENARHLGFDEVRAGVAIKHPLGDATQMVECEEICYSDNLESMVFCAEYPDGVGSWDKTKYKCKYKEWKTRRLIQFLDETSCIFSF